MANLRELRDRIRSVNSTKKITKAQELIATSRITKAQARVEASLPYAHELANVMNRLAAASSLDHPMLREREDGKVAAILVVSSDRGMCGGYNNNIFKKAVLEHYCAGQSVSVFGVLAWEKAGRGGVGFVACVGRVDRGRGPCWPCANDGHIYEFCVIDMLRHTHYHCTGYPP